MRFRLVRDERGMTLAEMVVAMAIGGIVTLGVTTMVVSQLHATKRVSKRVEATQSSRQVLTYLIDELNSACIMPKIAPVQQASSGTVLRFIHARGNAVTPVPTLSVVSLEESTLWQRDYALKEGVAPNWVFNETKPVAQTQLMTGVGQINATKPIFRYYAFSTETGAPSEVPLPTPLTITNALTAIQVGVALKVVPRGGLTDEGTPAHIEDSATLRLTAAPFQSGALPCQ
jgi:prepilin-type N-terminal cleavage/methylation domain-containing protein